MEQDETNVPKGHERLMGATIAQSFEDPGIHEMDTAKEIYKLLRSLPEGRRARVFKYVAEVLGDQD